MNDVEFDEPVLSPCKELKDAWTLEGNWSLEFNGRKFELEKGFITDGASIPALLIPICGERMSRPRLYAALVHDWMYDGNDVNVSREEADDIYRDILIKLGFGRFRAWIEWSVLRIFGGSHWKGEEDKV